MAEVTNMERERVRRELLETRKRAITEETYRGAVSLESMTALIMSFAKVSHWSDRYEYFTDLYRRGEFTKREYRDALRWLAIERNLVEPMPGPAGQRLSPLRANRIGN